jgi:hypothetical protein
LQLDVLSKVGTIFGGLQEVDAGPTPVIENAALSIQRDAKLAIERWQTIPTDVTALNAELEAAGVEKIKLP